MKLPRLVKSKGLDPQEIRTRIEEVVQAYGPSVRVLDAKIERPQNGKRVDLVMSLKTPGGMVRQLYVEIKANVTPSSVREPLRQLRAVLPEKGSPYPVLAATFLGPEARRICREEGVGYFDLAGNAYLKFKDFILDRTVEKNPYPRMGRPSSIFTPVSSRVLRGLLEEPQRTWKLAELAKVAGVSLGQTFKVCRQLQLEGYVSRTSRTVPLTLEKPGPLLDVWRGQYTFVAHRTWPFYSFERDPDRLMAAIAQRGKEREWRYAVTSFVAASRIAPFVRGSSQLICYVEFGALEGWQKALDLRLVEEGAALVLVVPNDPGVFYRTQQVNGVNLVGNIQLYLDLYSNPARGQEQADQLRKERIKF